MPNIKPFQAVFYNSKKIKDLSKVFCPPYDVITPEEQNYYLNRSPYNFTHIVLGKDKLRDDKSNNKYTRAKKTYKDWLKRGILVQDEKSCIYFYKQEYKILGQYYSRLGFISLMELQDEKDSKVIPHENTHSDAIDDRLRLWRSLNSNLSCIFVCYADKQKKIENVFYRYVISSKPFLDIEDGDKVRHKLWRLEDPQLIQDVSDTVSRQNVFIADGHHRYKVAMKYQRARLGRKMNPNGQEPYNYVMTYYTNIDSKNLTILPMHRIVKHLPKNLNFLDEYFRIDKVKTKEDLMILLMKAGINEHAFGLYTEEGRKLLRLKSKFLINQLIKDGSKEYKALDATILKHLVFDRVGLDSDDIIYTKDLDEATGMVDRRKADASFIMNAVKISQLKSVALNGEKMPPKSTYFYPKVLSGLTVYKMN